MAQATVGRAAFFSGAGDLVDHTIEGEKPPVVRFHYTNGQATYDGREWTFALGEVPAPSGWDVIPA